MNRDVKKKPVVLYFHHGAVPTDEQYKEGLSIGGRFRNADHVVPGENLEHADFVAGEVPEAYAEKYPLYGQEEGGATGLDDPTSGEQVGAFWLHQIERGKWAVVNEEGEQLNEELLNKADARKLALDNTEED